MGRKKAVKVPDAERGGVDMNWYYGAVHEYWQREDWPRLSSRGFVVWTALWARAVPLLGIVSASHEQLRVMTKSRSKATIKLGVEELVAKGYIARIATRGHRPQNPWTYRMLRKSGLKKSRRMGQVENLLVKCLTEADGRKGTDG
jgi:hypothetical protein